MIAAEVAQHYENALQSASSGNPLLWDKLPRVSLVHGFLRLELDEPNEI